jgi:hypothetical protein
MNLGLETGNLGTFSWLSPIPAGKFCSNTLFVSFYFCGFRGTASKAVCPGLLIKMKRLPQNRVQFTSLPNIAQ